MSNLQIVAVCDENFEDLLDLIEQYQEFYGVEDIDAQQNREFFARFLERPEEGLQFVAYREGEAVGFTTLYFPFSSTRATQFALMNDLFVRADARGGGTGEALIKKAAAVAAQQGFDELAWMTARDNHVAQRLYDRFDVRKSAWFEYTMSTRID